jgi:glutamine amidotransferase-like uncharacterized protein
MAQGVGPEFKPHYCKIKKKGIKGRSTSIKQTAQLQIKKKEKRRKVLLPMQC